MDDSAAVWRTLDHFEGVRGHKRVGLSVALDGHEDDRITREAADFWAISSPENGPMRPYLDEVAADVRARARSGALAWDRAGLRSLIKDPDDGDRGIVEYEGAEIEGELEAGEVPWETEAEQALNVASRRKAFQEMLVEDAPAGLSIIPLPADDRAELREAQAAARSAHQLEVMGKMAADLGMRSVEWLVAEKRHKLNKAMRDGQDETRKHNQVLAREMERWAAEEREKLAKARLKAAARRHRAAVLKHIGKLQRQKAAKAKAAREVAAAERERNKEEREKALRRVPRHWDPKEVGPPGGPAGKRNANKPEYVAKRVDLMERVRLRAPPLPPDLERDWVRFRDWFVKDFVEKHPAMPGGAFLHLTTRLVGELETRPAFFQNWFAQKVQEMPKPAGAFL